MANYFKPLPEESTSDIENQATRTSMNPRIELCKIGFAFISLTFGAAFFGGLLGQTIRASHS